MFHVVAAVLHLGGQDVGVDLRDHSQQFDALLRSATSTRLQHLCVQQLNLEEELVDQHFLIAVEVRDHFPHPLDHGISLGISVDFSECDLVDQVRRHVVENMNTVFTEVARSNLNVPLDDLPHSLHHLILLFLPGGVTGDEVAVVRNDSRVILAKQASDHRLAPHVDLLGLLVFLKISVKVTKCLQSY